MKDFYLEDTHDILLFLKTKRFPFGRKEKVLLEFAPTVLEYNAELILKNVATICEDLYLKSEKYITSPDFLLCLKWEPLEPDEYSIPKENYFKIAWKKHLANAADLENLCEKNVSALEITLNEENLPRLLPSLMLLKNQKLDFILLEPSGLGEKHLPILIEILDYLKINWRKDLPLLFSPSHPLSEKWEALTLNPFRGPSLIDIDLCNSCDHDCLFCGLHHPDLKSTNSKLASLKASTSFVLKMINELPPAVTMVTLGGAGEPFLHPDIMPIIRALREKNINICLFSNFAHMTQNILDELKDLVFDSPLNIWIIVNVSGPDPVTYQATRPSQKAKTFFKIIKHLKYNTELLRRYHKATSITLMNVVNNKNYKTLPEFVALAKDLGVFNLWFKPMEPHGEVTLPLLLNDDEKKEFKIYKAKANWAARKLGVEFLTKENWSEKSQEISQNELSQFPLLNFHLQNNFHDLPSKDEFIRQRFTQEKFSKKTNTVLGPSTERETQCFVAYDYLRVTTQNEVLPCCAFDSSVGKINNDTLFSFWLSDPYEHLREKIKNHQFDFCKFCPHEHINNKFKSLRS